MGGASALLSHRLDRLGDTAASSAGGAQNGAADFEAQAARLSASLDDEDDQGAGGGNGDAEPDERAIPQEVCSLFNA